jgi:hypothetical protein
MPKRTVPMLLVFLFAFTIVMVTGGSSQVEAQNRPVLTGTPDLAGTLARIEQEIEERRKEFGVPGVAVAIIKDG